MVDWWVSTDYTEKKMLQLGEEEKKLLDPYYTEKKMLQLGEEERKLLQ